MTKTGCQKPTWVKEQRKHTFLGAILAVKYSKLSEDAHLSFTFQSLPY